MKTLTTFILLLAFTFLKAQTNPATPNASFNYWTHYTTSGGYDDPNDWQCLNPTTAILGSFTCFKDSTNPLPGCKYDVALITQTFTIEVAPGALTTGTINTGNQTINGGLPYTLRPDSMIGYYHYVSESGDNGDCEFYLFGATHSDTIGQAFFKTPTSTVTAWTRFSLPIIYASSATPDTALWIFSSSLNQADAKVGSQLYLDSLGLVFDSTSGIKNINRFNNISVWPNPTKGPVSVNNGSGTPNLVLNLMDVTGRVIDEERITNGINNLDLSGLAEGIYIYSLLDEQNSVVKTGKIIVQK